MYYNNKQTKCQIRLSKMQCHQYKRFETDQRIELIQLEKEIV